VRHHRSDDYLAEQVLLNKRQIYGGAPKVNCYRADKLHHTRAVAYLVELVLLNKHQVLGGGAYLDGYRHFTLENLESRTGRGIHR